MVKAVIFTDFDGTVTLQDSNDYLTDNYGFGKEARGVIFEGVLNGTTQFRDGFTQMIDSVKTPINESLDILKANIELDPGFKETFEWAQANDIPIVVVSSGMEPIIKALLTKLLGADAVAKIDIVANAVTLDDKDKMTVVYRDESGHGHDKSRTINIYKKEYEAKQNDKPIYFYCGDGISDLSAAKECDLLFAKRGKDLVTFCKRENVPFHEFDSFKDILSNMKDVIAGDKTVKELMEN